MTKVTIRAGNFAGLPAELIERGDKTSKLKVVLFGRETIVDLANDLLSTSDEPFDPFESFAQQIRTDRRWEAGVATEEWWLERANDLTADTWEEHLQEKTAAQARATEEAERLVAKLRDALPDDPGHAEIDAYFREHEDIFRPFRVQWRKSRENVSGTDASRDDARARADAIQRIAYRMWWSAQPRETEGCRDFLESVWSGDDYQAMVQAEYEAFDRWGREAVELIFNRYRDEPLEVAELDALPEGHPWREWSGIDPGTAVRRGFAELHGRAPVLVDSLAHHVRAIYVVERDGDCNLVYACDAEDSYGERRKPFLSLVVGGPGLNDQELDTLDEHLPEYTRSTGWSVPEDLKCFYRVHHGLGWLSAFAWHFDNMGSIYPANQLEVLGDIMNEIAEEQDFEPEGFRFDDLLTFFEDGAGNGQNFFRPGPTEPPIGTVDWDHETRQISSVETFWEFLDHRAGTWFGT